MPVSLYRITPVTRVKAVRAGQSVRAPHHAGITSEVRDDHAAYTSHWLSVLRENSRAIFSAAAHAQRAVDFLQAAALHAATKVAAALEKEGTA